MKIMLFILFVVAVCICLSYSIRLFTEYLHFSKLGIGDMVYTSSEPDGYGTVIYEENYVLTNPLRIVNVERDKYGKAKKIILENGETFTFWQLHKSTYET